MTTPPPIKLKQSANTTAAAASSAAQDARLLVRETMRISANLATSSSPIVGCGGGPAASTLLQSDADEMTALRLVEDQFVGSSLRLICSEDVDGRRWNYVAERDVSGKFKRNSLRAISLQSPKAPAEETAIQPEHAL